MPSSVLSEDMLLEHQREETGWSSFIWVLISQDVCLVHAPDTDAVPDMLFWVPWSVGKR